jgi:hypothetical protein
MPKRPPHEEGCTCEWCGDPAVKKREIMAQAKIGLDALIDEATGYQKVRPKGDLEDRYVKHWSKQQHTEQEAVENLFAQDA